MRIQELTLFDLAQNRAFELSLFALSSSSGHEQRECRASADAEQLSARVLPVSVVALVIDTSLVFDASLQLGLNMRQCIFERCRRISMRAIYNYWLDTVELICEEAMQSGMQNCDE